MTLFNNTVGGGVKAVKTIACTFEVLAKADPKELFYDMKTSEFSFNRPDTPLMIESDGAQKNKK